MVTRARLYGATCCLVMAGTLAACLWPFRSPSNEVAWFAHGNGVCFGHHGTVLSRDRIRPPNVGKQSGWTLEIWLRPERVHQSHTILAFYNPERPSGFSLHQSQADLLVERKLWNRRYGGWAGKFYADNLFLSGRSAFVTLVSSPQETDVYVDGNLVRTVPRFVLSASDLSGQLVLANSPVANDSWHGELRGLALYHRELTAEEVRQQYESWTRNGQANVSEGDCAVALYAFKEHCGDVIHNQVALGADLYIPKRYMELHHTLLGRPWDEYYPGWNYRKDVLINIGGFIPLGFFFYAYLSLAWPFRRSALVTIILGAVLSLTIEILQGYLPTRDSGLTDVITNTLGTTAGVRLCQCASVVGERFKCSRFSMLRFLGTLFTRDRLYART